MNLLCEPYLVQLARWPRTGRYVLAQYDEESVVVYQAYRPAIGHFAVNHGYFGGEFSLSRMSWVKPGFLWMMYRSGWATKPGQEVVLAIRLKRFAFDNMLAQAVHSTCAEETDRMVDVWRQQVTNTSVLMQWDPDHDPSGAGVERRALQLGLRGSVLACYARDWIIEIEDISQFVAQQYKFVTRRDYEQLITPRETVYSVPAQIP
jgi:hypothetical protein